MMTCSELLPKTAERPEPKDLKVSVITSYTDLDLRGVVEELSASGIRWIDLYLLRDRDADELEELYGDTIYRYSRACGLSPVSTEAMILALGPDTLCRWIKERLADKVEVASIATNIPSLSSNYRVPGGQLEPEPKEARVYGTEAMCYVVEIAKQLGCRAIEIVAGPAGDLLPIPPEKLEAFGRGEVALADLLDYQHNFYARQSRLCNQLLRVSGLASPGLGLAFEVEPDDQFLLSSWNQIGMFDAAIRGDPALAPTSDVLGYNLDIGHFIALSEREASRSPLALVERMRTLSTWIYHCHCSDHPVGGSHLADLVPGTVHDASVFRAWLSLYLTAGQTQFDRSAEPSRRREQASVYWSGFVAIELEGCGDVTYVEEARDFIQECIRGI